MLISPGFTNLNAKVLTLPTLKPPISKSGVLTMEDTVTTSAGWDSKSLTLGESKISNASMDMEQTELLLALLAPALSTIMSVISVTSENLDP